MYIITTSLQHEHGSCQEKKLYGCWIVKQILLTFRWAWPQKLSIQSRHAPVITFYFLVPCLQ